jgi:pyridoxal phosphate-dependent aminotransferase EpsN
MSQRIYLSPPHIGADELSLVQEAFASNWIAPLGPHVDGFEREFCAFTGIKAACALSSGTAAIHLALRLLGVGPGDSVFCSTFTFAASANPILYQGAIPVFIDSDLTGWNMDPELLAKALKDAAAVGKLPKTVIVVDLYGQCADYDSINKICAEYGVPVIQDSAESVGATYKGQPAGRQGHFGVFSFNGNKIITTSGGGMLLSDNEKLIAEARFLSTQARDPAPHYQHSTYGYNYRLSNVLAAIGRGQLRVLKDRVASRRANEAFYRKALGDIPGITFMPEAPWGVSNRWLTCIIVDPVISGTTREKIYNAFAAENIETRPLWKPLHLQPVFADAKAYSSGVSEKLFADGLCLPSGSALTEVELERIVSIIRKVVPSAS